MPTALNLLRGLRMESKPAISVVLICYNHEKYIDEAINSILSQTYTDFELIIVDDGSSDNTLKIIQGYEDPRILVLAQENSGPSSALNAGIDKSRGQFIAFMSGDDVSFPNRLITQIKQIVNADMVFCIPQIIGPNSEILDERVCRWFFGREFENTAELYRLLFTYGNFLCAPSGFCRRTAIEKVGRFRRGLMQLQDFDYWIRVCKKKLDIKMFKDPLIQYRHLYGANLSGKTNTNRIRVETLGIYRSFFDEVPIDLLREAFGERITSDALDNCPEVEIDKSFLFLDHPKSIIKVMGLERIIHQLEDDEIYEKLRSERAFDMASISQLTKSINLEVFYGASKFRNTLSNIREQLARYFHFDIIGDPIWTETHVKQRIQSSLEQNDFDKAIKLTRVYRRYPPGPTLLATIGKILSKIRTILARMRTRITNLIPTRLANLIPTRTRTQVTERVYLLSRMYDYCKESDCIVYEGFPEKVYLQRPMVIGQFEGDLPEGEAFCPQTYVSVVNNAIITGGSSLVVSREGNLLSDEMVDFTGKDYGTKSPHIWFQHKNKVILAYIKRSNTRIKEGIILSCDHDNNYFHWLVECLPKLLLIDTLQQFKDAPLLIPKGLHKNLEIALKKVNINGRRLIYLDYGVAYHVERLIFPSALSRVVDRYLGRPVYNADVVLSHKWISKVSAILKRNLQYDKKPWRKLFITRRKSYRSLENHEELELMLIEHNFESVELDNVSLDFQIELFSQASVVIAPTGASLTNMLFCQPGTKIVLLMSNHETMNYYLWSELGNIAKLDLKIIIGERLFNVTDYFSVHDDYVIDPKILLDEIEKHEHN